LHNDDEGKEEQIFLTGLDLDHDADKAIVLDGLAVNFASYAYDQGYADLHA